jgi:quinol monooxygenase YgiN
LEHNHYCFVAFKPKPDKQEELAAVVAKHIHVLRSQNLVTDKAAYVMRAANGTVIEVFEWRSAEAIAEAHSNPAVQALWGEFAKVCDYVPLASLDEAGQMFAEFDAA